MKCQDVGVNAILAWERGPRKTLYIDGSAGVARGRDAHRIPSGGPLTGDHCVGGETPTKTSIARHDLMRRHFWCRIEFENKESAEGRKRSPGGSLMLGWERVEYDDMPSPLVGQFAVFAVLPVSVELSLNFT